MKTRADVPGALGSGNVSRLMLAADVEASEAPRTAGGIFPRPSRPVRQAITPTARPAQHIPAKTNRSTKRIAAPLLEGPVPTRPTPGPHSTPRASPTPSDARLISF